jgi:hypothetical protein
VGQTLLSGFSAPKAPRYAGFSMADRRAFALKYNEYVRECQQSSDALGYRIVARPVGTCIEARSKQFAAQMHLGAKVDEVTNGRWAAYFVDALVYQSPDYGDLADKIKTTVILDETILTLSDATISG